MVFLSYLILLHFINNNFLIELQNIYLFEKKVKEYFVNRLLLKSKHKKSLVIKIDSYYYCL
jgi:hypothetical protein